MNYFKTTTVDGKLTVVEVATSAPSNMEGWVCRWDFADFDRATQIAAAATENAGKLFIAIDAGECVSPRFDVIEAPCVGDKISYAFNGDYYPDGEIAMISKTMSRITSTTGRIYTRRRKSGSWISKGTWTLVNGHRKELNPHF